MEKLRLRCPSCSKLYEVNSSDIKSQSPQFDCLVCETRFGFDLMAPTNYGAIVTFAVAKPTPAAVTEAPPATVEELAQESFEAFHKEVAKGAEKNSTKACPKCGAVSDRKAHECYSCRVIFEKLEQLPTDPTLRAQPSLVRKWKNVLNYFDKEDLHEDFLKSCHELDALRFAILKYEELKNAQGGSDEICERRITQAQGMLQVSLATKTLGNSVYEAPARILHPKWHKYIALFPFVVALTMICIGFFSLGLRNLVGAGVAILLLNIGLILMWKGRLSLADFVE